MNISYVDGKSQCLHSECQEDQLPTGRILFYYCLLPKRINLKRSIVRSENARDVLL